MTVADAPSFPALVCPHDGAPLAAPGHGDALVCSAGHTYPVREDIPRLLFNTRGYADAFGEQWRQYRVTQLDSYTQTSISQDRLRRCLGEQLWGRLGAGSRLEVLEAGCGAGRFTEILLRRASAGVTSTDLSAAVEPNQVNFPQSSRHRVIQCDINHFPFAAGQFDVVVCLGVIQHTQRPEQTIADLYAQVKPGGWLVVDHYTHSLSLYTRFGERLMRPILKRLAPRKGMAATKSLTRWFFPLHRAARHWYPLQMAVSRFSPLLTYFHKFPELTDPLQYEWAELDTHDSLTDFYKHARSGRSIARTLAQLGAAQIWVAKGGNGVEARCQRPQR
jgi:SAM-dependent methyltransferase